jgi:SAM-dependent methyltransferase
MSGPRAFAHADDCDDVAELVGYLDTQGSLPLFQAVDHLLLAELRIRPGSRVLDVGCGVGDDALAIAALVAPEGWVTGVDASAPMIAEARRRAAGNPLPVDFQVGRADDLVAPDASFDACRFERVLQHLDDPGAALCEAARVLRPGGRVAVCEPDWCELELTGADPEVTRRVLDLRLRTIPTPDAGAQLQWLLAGTAFGEVRTLELRLSGNYGEARRALRLDAYAEEAARTGAVTEAAAADWLRALDRAATTGQLDVQVSFHLAAGTRR